MISKQELLDAIEQCERAPMSYQNCEKLATFYAIYDHLYAEPEPQVERVTETKISVSGDSDFYRKIDGSNASSVWKIMDELMQTLQLVQPRLYDGVMQKIEDL